MEQEHTLNYCSSEYANDILILINAGVVKYNVVNRKSQYKEHSI